jgi:MinD-like ATPase involved in chromosome partitioning or flagellar assembly
VSSDPANPLFARAPRELEPPPGSSPEPTQPLAPDTPEPRRGGGLADALRTSPRRTPRTRTDPEAASSPAPGPSAPALRDASLTPAPPNRPETLDDAYRVRNGREVRDTRWTRLLDSTWHLLTSSAGRQEQELDEAGEELYLRGLANGVVLACGSAKGGSGKTTLTQALAEQLASILKVAVLVLDADLEWGTALNAAPPSARRGDTLVDAYNARERIDSAAQLAPFLVNLRGGAQLLPGPSDAALIEQTGPEQMAAVLALVRRFYPIVLLDLPPGAGFSCGNPIARWGLQEADEILAVATPKKANVDQVRRLLAFLADQYPGKPITLALNATPARPDRAIQRIARVAGQASPERFAEIPYDAILDRQMDAGTLALDTLAQPTRIAIKQLTHQLATQWCR